MAETRKHKESQTDEEPVEENDEAGDELPSPDRALAKKDETEEKVEAEESGETEGDEGGEEEVLPAQMGHRRYVYAVYFALGIALAYFLSKAGLALWHRLSQWTPKVGEPREDLMTPISAVIAALVVFFTYRRPDVRTLSDEVALELSKVEWPTRDQLRRSTTIVVLATIGSSLAFWLYDIGANHAIGFIADSPKTWIVLLKVLVGAVAIYVIRALGLRFLAGEERRA
jgi:preprotein translocase subunit SecE